MKFAITSITMSTNTRRRMGKATTTVVDNDAADRLFQGCTTPHQVELRYEELHNAGMDVKGVKVVDIKQLTHLPPERNREEQDHNISVLQKGGK